MKHALERDLLLAGCRVITVSVGGYRDDGVLDVAVLRRGADERRRLVRVLVLERVQRGVVRRPATYDVTGGGGGGSQGAAPAAKQKRNI